MIDWLMPPQTVVTFIFIGWGGLAPQGILLQLEIRKNSSFYSDSGSTGQTVEGHWSDRWRQPDQPCAKFACEHTPPYFLVKLAV
jgi:hypothetical protein